MAGDCGRQGLHVDSEDVDRRFSSLSRSPSFVGNSKLFKKDNGLLFLNSEQGDPNFLKKRQGPLVIREGPGPGCPPKVINLVDGKGKELVIPGEVVSPVILKTSVTPSVNSASSSGQKIFVNQFENPNAIPGLCRSVINADSSNSVDKHSQPAYVRGSRPAGVKLSVDLPKNVAGFSSVNPWSNKPYIKLNFKDDDVFLSEDGKAVKLDEEIEMLNSNRLLNSLVIKVFGKELPSSTVAWEIRKQWGQYGHFHFTTLGKGWFLCSFSSGDMVEVVHSGGPWFMNGHIVGMERWTPEFTTASMRGLSSLIWIRLPHLPLQCWDEKNVACIASRIGKPLMLDGNMFQWGRREFARVCVRVSLNQPLSLGVWVDNMAGRFFQKVEYEKIANFCFKCGKIGHVENDCSLKENTPEDVVKTSVFGTNAAPIEKQEERNSLSHLSDLGYLLITGEVEDPILSTRW